MSDKIKVKPRITAYEAAHISGYTLNQIYAMVRNEKIQKDKNVIGRRIWIDAKEFIKQLGLEDYVEISITDFVGSDSEESSKPEEWYKVFHRYEFEWLLTKTQSAYDIAIYAAITHSGDLYTDEHEYSKKQIADILGINEETADKSILRLKERGIIEVVHYGEGTANTYRAVRPPYIPDDIPSSNCTPCTSCPSMQSFLNDVLDVMAKYESDEGAVA